MKRADRAIPIVKDVQILNASGPWNTKSGGTLNVILAISLATAHGRFFRYNEKECNSVPRDIRGLRAYTVRDLQQGRIGGTEWHRIRGEMVFALQGSVRWTCEDLFGDKRDLVLTTDMGVWMPPFILHTYQVEEDGSILLAIANTLFIPDDSTTHDTYPMDAFRTLQSEYATKSK